MHVPNGAAAKGDVPDMAHGTDKPSCSRWGRAQFDAGLRRDLGGLFGGEHVPDRNELAVS